MMAVPRSGEIDRASHDPADRALIGHVHPPNWKNPAGGEAYNLVVLGGGTAGLVCAMGLAPICTEGPSRPIERPDPMHSTPVRNFSIGTRAGMCPPCRRNAASVCGTPLPRTSGKTVASRMPVTTLTRAGTANSRRCVGANPKNRWLVRSMASVKSTAASPPKGRFHGAQSGRSIHSHTADSALPSTGRRTYCSEMRPSLHQAYAIISCRANYRPCHNRHRGCARASVS